MLQVHLSMYWSFLWVIESSCWANQSASWQQDKDMTQRPTNKLYHRLGPLSWVILFLNSTHCVSASMHSSIFLEENATLRERKEDLSGELLDTSLSMYWTFLLRDRMSWKVKDRPQEEKWKKDRLPAGSCWTRNCNCLLDQCWISACFSWMEE